MKFEATLYFGTVTVPVTTYLKISCLLVFVAKEKASPKAILDQVVKAPTCFGDE
jgi:hypothetical protein